MHSADFYVQLLELLVRKYQLETKPEIWIIGSFPAWFFFEICLRKNLENSPAWFFFKLAYEKILKDFLHGFSLKLANEESWKFSCMAFLLNLLKKESWKFACIVFLWNLLTKKTWKFSFSSPLERTSWMAFLFSLYFANNRQ